MPGRGAGPVQSPGGGLEHAATNAKLIGGSGDAQGLIPKSSSGGRHLPLRPRHPRLRHECQSAPAGCKLKTSMSRKGGGQDNAPTQSFRGALEGGPFVRQKIRDPQAGHERSYELDDAL